MQAVVRGGWWSSITDMSKTPKKKHFFWFFFFFFFKFQIEILPPLVICDGVGHYVNVSIKTTYYTTK